MEINKYKSKQLEQANDYQKLLHRVFVQSEDGKKLIDIWRHTALMTEGYFQGKDAYDLGRTEGRKEFVRELLIQSKQAEER